MFSKVFKVCFSRLALIDCDLWGRKINFTSSKTLVGWLVDVATDRDARHLRPARM